VAAAHLEHPARFIEHGALFLSDKSSGLVEIFWEFYPEELRQRWQRCAVHSYRDEWTAVPTSKLQEVAAMLKPIHAQEDRAVVRQKPNRWLGN
jgi:transposase-like protein